MWQANPVRILLFNLAGFAALAVAVGTASLTANAGLIVLITMAAVITITLWIVWIVTLAAIKIAGPEAWLQVMSRRWLMRFALYLPCWVAIAANIRVWLSLPGD